jgi:hypothetical protein
MTFAHHNIIKIKINDETADGGLEIQQQINNF